jgi:hypothetical protein
MIFQILYEDLEKRKLCMKFVIHSFTDVREEQRVTNLLDQSTLSCVGCSRSLLKQNIRAWSGEEPTRYGN